MGLSRIYRQEMGIYHASLGWGSDMWGNLNSQQRWRCLTMALQQLHTCKSSFEVHAFVMMGTHLHLLFSTRRELEQYVMEEFNKNILQILLKKQASSGLETPLFSELVASFRQLLHVYKYIYRNPVEAHIAQKVEDYRYSTLCEVLGRQQPSLGVLDLLRTVHDPNRILSWLNENSAKELYYSTSAQHFF